MNQLAPVIKWIKKNVFWIGCLFLSVAMIGIWFFASGALAEQTRKNTINVKNSITKANAILSVTPDDIEEGGAHPNDVSEKGMKQELSETIDSIVEAWTVRKTAQEKILEWPSVIPSKKFVEFFGKYRPPETFPEVWNSGIRLQQMLELYRTKIPDQMIHLCDDILRTRWNYDPANMAQAGALGDDYDDEDDEDEDEDDDGLGAGFGGLAGGGEFGEGSSTVEAIDYNKYAVRWSDVNQQLWQAKLTTFQGRDGNQFIDPTPLQCYMLQQDLWLLEAMFRIIREVNGDSNANDLSTIKNLDHVVFGREVGSNLGELTPADQRLAGNMPTGDSGDEFVMDDFDEEDEDEDEEDDDMGGIFGGGKMAGASGDFSGATLTTTTNPYDLRYVDVDFEPLSADVVKRVITGQDLPEIGDNLELIVAKRVPVRIAVKMDERRIADFMAACANSPFAFEIQQVRWNRHTPGGDLIGLDGAGSTSGAGGSGAAAAGKGGSMGLSGMGMGGLSGFGGGASAIDSQPIEVRTSYDVHVEFYGIVKIYNPVREDELRRAAGLIDEESVDPGAAANIANPATGGDSTKP